jgi:rhamnose utilization protein RhaD (predicted bifunctional aldolase and dehydrogenase)
VNKTPEFQSLRTLSAKLGANPLLVQAAGGNTSIKQDGVMWIKASGTWLMDAEKKDIFVPVDLKLLTQALAGNNPDSESCVAFVRQEMNPLGLRPSIETSVHGRMSQPVVLHVHCVNTIAWAIRQDAEHQLSQRLTDFNWSFIPYARPGLQLSYAIAENLKPASNVIVLQNHGLAVAAETVAEAETLLSNVVTKLQCPIRSGVPPDVEALKALCANTNYAPASHPTAHTAALDPLARQWGCAHVYYPDHVVFLGTHIPTDISTNAPAVAIPGKGVLIHRQAKSAVEPILFCLGEIFLRTSLEANLKALSATEIDQLLNWDAEKYRQTLQQPSALCDPS